MKIKKIWYDAEHIYGRDEKRDEYSQSFLWHPKLRTATDLSEDDSLINYKRPYILRHQVTSSLASHSTISHASLCARPVNHLLEAQHNFFDNFNPDEEDV